MKKINIRCAAVRDLNNLVKIETQVFPTPLFDSITRRQYRYLICKANAGVWVAECQPTVIASMVILFRKNSLVGRLYSISVLPNYQGQGIGSLLISHAEQVLLARGCTELRQEVRVDNTVLINRYIRMGFSHCGLVEDYYPDGKACVKLKKNIFK